MNRLCYLVALALVAACVATAHAGKYNEKTLVGTWEFDVVKLMKQAMEGQEVPPGMDIEKMAQDMYMRVTFNKDGSYSVASRIMGAERTEEGKWEFVKSDADNITVKTTNADSEEQTLTITFADNDHFDALAVNGEESLTMSAARAKDAGKKEEKKDEDAKKE